jgi:cytochrome P450
MFLTAEVDGHRLTDNDILDICYLFLLAGLDTVTATLGCSVSYLAQHADHRDALVADPSLVPAAVEELLRWETPVPGVPRIATRDVEIAGETIAAGESVMCLIGAADVDPTEFPDPETIDFAREGNRHLAFGGGVHRCLGSHLARLELRVALEELHRRIPDYALKPGEEPRYTMGIRSVDYLPLVFTPGAAR